MSGNEASDSLAEKLRLIRRWQGCSQEELARQLGVSFPTVNSWERSKSRPYPRHRKAIEDLYRRLLAAHAERLVLVVEDDPATGLVLANYVEMALPTWKPVVVDNGYDAILQIGLLKPRVVLLDIMMPEIDGFRVFQRLRELDELRETRVIFVTAATDEAVLARARESGAFAVIQKPLRRELIVELLQAAAG